MQMKAFKSNCVSEPLTEGPVSLAVTWMGAPGQEATVMGWLEQVTHGRSPDVFWAPPRLVQAHGFTGLCLQGPCGLQSWASGPVQTP